MVSTDAVRSGPLCWGQYWSWQEQLLPPARRSPNLVFRRRIEVPATFTAVDVAGLLRGAVDRYEALRTTYDTGPDGAVTQVVWPPEPARYEIRDLPLSDPDRWPPWEFDLAREWPVKVGVVRTGAATAYLVLVVHHVATDHLGMGNLVADLRRTLDPGRPAPPATACRQPLDFAAEENSPVGDRATRRAISHWQRHLPDIAQVLDATRARMTAATPSASMYRVRVVSGPARAQLSRSARTLGHSEPTVLIGVVAQVLGRHLGLPAVVVTALAANRHLPGAQQAVCALAQVALIRVACPPGAAIADTIRAAADATITGYRHAYYDRHRLLTAFDAVGDLPVVNIVRHLDDRPAAETHTHTVDVVSRPCVGYNIHLHLFPNALAIDLRIGTHLTDATTAAALAAAVVSGLPNDPTVRRTTPDVVDHQYPLDP